MPVYVIRARAEVLGHRRARLAQRVTAAHARTTGEPGSTVEVVVEEVRADDQHFVDGRPAARGVVSVHGHVHAGRGAPAAGLAAAVREAVVEVLGSAGDEVRVSLSELLPTSDEREDATEAAGAAVQLLLMRVLAIARHEEGRPEASPDDFGTPRSLDDACVEATRLARVLAALARGDLDGARWLIDDFLSDRGSYADLVAALRQVLDPRTAPVDDATLVGAARAAAAASPAAVAATLNTPAPATPPTIVREWAPRPVVHPEIPPEPA